MEQGQVITTTRYDLCHVSGAQLLLSLVKAAMILKSVNIQYSFLLARPEKVVYFLRTAKYQFIIKPHDNSRVKEGSILRIV